MTRRTSAPSSNRTGRRPAPGFTLVELLVVIGIIVLLLALLSPMIARAYRNAERARVSADLNAISAALEAYKQDFNSYPVPSYNSTYGTATPTPSSGVAPQRPNPPTGAQLLCQALIGPCPKTDIRAGSQRPIQDGVDGAGFRVRRFPGVDGQMNTADDDLNSKAYPPYLETGRFKIGDPEDTSSTLTDPERYGLTFTILDRYRRAILYFPAHGKPNIRENNGFVGLQADRPLFWADDNPIEPNSPTQAALTLEKMRLFLGDTSKNGKIDGGEVAVFQGPYILWSTGPDETYGPIAGEAGDTNQLDAPDVDKCDDITNFRS